MIAAIADTHTTLWYLFSDPRLGRSALDFINAIIARGDNIGVSAISIAEMVYLTEKSRIPENSLSFVTAAMANPRVVLRYVPVDERIAMAMVFIPRDQVPDLPDRIIAATAHLYGVPAITRDKQIKESRVRTIW